MAKTISELRNQSIQVRDASAAGENTATRVGTVLNDIVGHIEDYENTQSSNNSSQDAKIEGVKSSLNAEIARAKTEESNLSTQIDTERTERQAAVSREETARIQADNDEKQARINADNAEQDARIKADNDEKTARENADITLRTMIQTEVSNRQIAVKQEEIRAMAAELANTQAIEDETTRATTAEAAETARATAEEERLQREIDNTNTNVETLEDKVNSNHGHFSDEVARLDLTDNEIKADLEAEKARATAAENANAQAIADENARATTEEERLQGEIDNTNTDLYTLNDRVNLNQGQLTELENTLYSRTFERDNLPAYNAMEYNAKIPIGRRVKNDGEIELLLATDSDYTNRHDISVGSTWTTTVEINYIQALADAGNAKLVVIGQVDDIKTLNQIVPTIQQIPSIQSYIDKDEKETKQFRGVSYNGTGTEYFRITTTAKIPIGTKFINNGVTIILADDLDFTHRKDISKGEIWVSTFEVNVISLSQFSGDYDIHTYPGYIDGVVRDAVFNTKNYGDNTITTKKIDFIVSKNLVNTNDPDIAIGKYLSSDGSLSTNSIYNTTGFIMVKPNTTYSVKSSNDGIGSRFVVQYNESKVPTGTFYNDASIKTITTGSNVRFIRVTFYAEVWNVAQVTEGEQPMPFTPYRIILDSQQVGIDADAIPNGSITREKLAFTPSEESTFKAFSVNGTLAQNEALTTPRVSISKNMAIIAKIDGEIESVNVGVSIGGYYGRYINLTPTEIKVYSGSASNLDNTFEHGLTLGETTIILISRDLGLATLKLFNNNGEVYECSFPWGVSSGDVKLVNIGNGSIDGYLSFMPRDINEKIWLFGDSYFSYESTERWLYYLLNYGYKTNLINAMGGESTIHAIAALNNLISLGAKPKYIVWCMGMNDGDDGQTPNSIWLTNTQTMLDICEQNNILPILATIPTVPARNHTKKTEWVRNSGYRYIDFAKAVEVDGTTYWKGWGTTTAMLSSDEVHPTAYGAKALASAAFAGCPELTIV